MKKFVPDYYGEFACIKGDCRHSCCVGWEIDIDEASLRRFREVPGELGVRLRENIADTDAGACFRLTADERCPFLNGEGLCDLILELGPDCLCQICDDHPRFRNFFSDREETGLGLCCEAAGRLILGRREKVRLQAVEDEGIEDELFDDEVQLLQLRDELISVAQDRRMPVAERVSCLLERCGMEMQPFAWGEWKEFLLGLERLDNAWACLLQTLDKEEETDLSPWETAFEQLLVYLIFRHLPGALEDDDIAGHIAFIVFAWMLVRRICASCQTGFGELVETCRLYSSEIEYSDENIAAIIARLYETNPDL